MQHTVRYDPLMSALLQEMTRQPTPHQLRPWQLKGYIPPKHLRLPGFDYGRVEESLEAVVHTRESIRLQPTVQAIKQSVSESKRRDTVTQEALRLVRIASKGDIESTGLTVQAPCAVDLWSCVGSGYIPHEGLLQKTEVLRI